MADLEILSSLNLDQFDNPNKSWLVWKHNFLMIMNKHAPIKKRKIRDKRTPWINNGLIIGKRYKNFLKKKAIKTQSVHDWTAFKVARNLYNRKIKQTIQSYYQNQLHNNSGNIKNTWKTVNNILNKSHKTSTIHELKSKSGENIESLDFPNAFNKHFIELGVELSSKIPETNITPELYLRDVRGSNGNGRSLFNFK